MKRKKLLAAGIIRDFRFKNKEEYQKYLTWIRGKYEVIEMVEKMDGTVLARILTQYNNTELIQLFES